MPDTKIGTLGAKLQDFIWIYNELSPLICKEALCSQYGADGDILFAELEQSNLVTRKEVPDGE